MLSNGSVQTASRVYTVPENLCKHFDATVYDNVEISILVRQIVQNMHANNTQRILRMLSEKSSVTID